MVTVDLSTITFDNDFYTLSLEDGSLLVLNKIDENFKIENTNVVIDCITITHVEYDAETDTSKMTSCTNVIGMQDSVVNIQTDYTQYLGKPLNLENIKYCTLEV